jgi:hypothetical protein
MMGVGLLTIDRILLSLLFTTACRHLPNMDIHLSMFGLISIYLRTDFHLFGPISICSDRFPFARTDFHLLGPISICPDRFPFVWIDFHYLDLYRIGSVCIELIDLYL